MAGFKGAMGWCLYSAQFTAWLILVRQVSRLENGPTKRLPRSSIAYQTLLNTSQVGLKFIDVMGIGVSHWSLLLRSLEETLDIRMCDQRLAAAARAWFSTRLRSS
jgi:hypothetical protein